MHDGGLDHVSLVDGADVDRRDRDLGALEELEQRLERAERRGHRVDPKPAVDLACRLGQLVQVLHAVLLEHLEVVGHVVEGDHACRARHHAVQVIGADLDAGGAVDLLVVDVIGLDAQLAQRLRREQVAHARHHRPAEATHDDPVATLERAVGQDHVGSRAEPLDDLHLEHGALHVRRPHDPVDVELLRHADEVHQDVGHALARVRRGGA